MSVYSTLLVNVWMSVRDIKKSPGSAGFPPYPTVNFRSSSSSKTWTGHPVTKKTLYCYNEL